MSFLAHSMPRERDLVDEIEADLRADRVEAARARLVAAEADLVDQRRRYRRAPHGQVQARLKTLQEAAHEALRAHAALIELSH